MTLYAASCGNVFSAWDDSEVLLEPTRTTCNNNFFFRAAHEEAVGTRPSRTALMRFGLPRNEVGTRPLPFARFPTFGINLLFLVITNPYFKF